MELRKSILLSVIWTGSKDYKLASRSCQSLTQMVQTAESLSVQTATTHSNNLLYCTLKVFIQWGYPVASFWYLNIRRKENPKENIVIGEIGQS